MPTVRTSLLLMLCLALRVGASPPVAAPRHVPAAAEIYGRSLTADDSYSYQGRQITTYWSNGRASAVLVSHRAPYFSRIEYLSPDSQRGRLLVSNSREQWQYDGQRRLLLHRVLAKNLPDEDDLTSYNLLRANYLLAVDPVLRTWADRKAYLLLVKRIGNHTLARKLWVDAGSGLVLKREIFHEDGKIAVTVAFSDISFRPNLPRTLFSLAGLAKIPKVRRQELAAQAETLIPLNLVPAQLAGMAAAPTNLWGYRLVGASDTSVNGTPLLHLQYSDGLNLVSLFEQRRAHARRPTLVPKAMRSLRIGKRLGHVGHRASLTTINWDTPTLNLTLMGELAEPTLAQIAVAADGGR